MAVIEKYLPDPEARQAQKSLPAFVTPTGTRGPNYALMSLFVDIVGTLVALLASASIIQSGVLLTPTVETTLSGIVVIAAMIVWGGTFLALAVYDVKDMSFQDEMRRVVSSIGLALFFLMGVLYVLQIRLPLSLLSLYILLDATLLLGWRYTAQVSYQVSAARQMSVPKRILLISGDKLTGRTLSSLQRVGAGHLEVVGLIDNDRGGSYEGVPVLGNLKSSLYDIVHEHEIDEIVIALPNRQSDQFANIIDDLLALSLQVYVVPNRLDLSLYNPRVAQLGDLPLVKMRTSPLTMYQRMGKRVFDIVGATAAIIAFSPIMLIVAIAIKLDSEGPVLFLQPRIGEGGRTFKMYKFRSMVKDADKRHAEVSRIDENGNIIHKVENDPRVTRIGKIIRRASIDELPQFFNVLRGEMSLVGPRPELPRVVEGYEPWQRQRFSVPQGVTGWWQINGRSDKPCHLHTDEDLYYIDHYSLLLDLKILFKTVPALLRGQGAY